MKRILEFIGFLFIVGELVTIYTLIACVSNCEPFPTWFFFAWYFYCAVLFLGLTGAVAALVGKCVPVIRRARNRRRRLGMVRVDNETGRYYYDRRGR